MLKTRVDKILGVLRESDRSPQNFEYISIQVVQTLSDFENYNALVHDIQLEDKIYFIDSNNLDITGHTLVFGAKSQINGFGQNVNQISSSEVGAVFFKSTTNLFMNDLEIVCNGTGQRIWQHIGDGTVTEGESFELNRFNVLCFQTAGHGNELGFIKDIRQGFIGTMSVIGFENGFKLAGSWTGGFRVDNTIFIMCSGKFFYSDPTDNVIFARRVSSNANLTVPLGSIGYDFPETSFVFSGQYQLQEGNFSGLGTYVTLWSGLPPAYNYKANFKDNTGLQNTFAGGEWINSANTTTNVLVQNTYYQLTLNTIEKNLAWFSETNGEFEYLSETPLDVQVFLTVTLTGTSNNIVQIELRKRSALNVETALLSRLVTIQGTTAQGRAESITITTTTQLIFGDKIRVYGRNTSAAQPFTVLQDSNGIITAK